MRKFREIISQFEGVSEKTPMQYNIIKAFWNKEDEKNNIEHDDSKTVVSKINFLSKLLKDKIRVILIEETRLIYETKETAVEEL